MPESEKHITGLLKRWAEGEEAAFNQVVELVYPVMRKMASARLGGGARNQLDTTELVHEAYLRLVEQTRTDWQSREHFFAIGARVIRRVLVDHARHRARDKRGGDAIHVTLDEKLGLRSPEDTDWVGLDDCLIQFNKADPIAVQLIELRVFAGLSIDEAAETLKIGRSTAVRKWRLARAWLEEHWLK